MAVNLEDLTPAQQAIVDKIISIGTSLNRPAAEIEAVILTANAETSLDPTLHSSPTFQGLFQYSIDTWSAEATLYNAANPGDPITLDRNQALSDPGTQIKLQFERFDRFTNEYNSGQFVGPPTVTDPATPDVTVNLRY
jgi:hypothetical protein